MFNGKLYIGDYIFYIKLQVLCNRLSRFSFHFGNRSLFRQLDRWFLAFLHKISYKQQVAVTCFLSTCKAQRKRISIFESTFLCWSNDKLCTYSFIFSYFFNIKLHDIACHTIPVATAEVWFLCLAQVHRLDSNVVCFGLSYLTIDCTYLWKYGNKRLSLSFRSRHTVGTEVV